MAVLHIFGERRERDRYYAVLRAFEENWGDIVHLKSRFKPDTIRLRQVQDAIDGQSSLNGDWGFVATFINDDTAVLFKLKYL